MTQSSPRQNTPTPQTSPAPRSTAALNAMARIAAATREQAPSLRQPVAELATRLSRFGLTSHQDLREWQGDVPLPPELQALYREIGPENIWIDSLGDPILLFALDSLWGAQAGYRWNRQTGARLVDWDDEWFVIALQGEDPWIFDSRDGRVLLPAGDLGWVEREEEPVPVFTDVVEAMTAAVTLGEVFAAYAEDPFTDDLKVRPALIADAVTALTGVFPEAHPVLGAAEDRARSLAATVGYPVT